MKLVIAVTYPAQEEFIVPCVATQRCLLSFRLRVWRKDVRVVIRLPCDLLHFVRVFCTLQDLLLSSCIVFLVSMNPWVHTHQRRGARGPNNERVMSKGLSRPIPASPSQQPSLPLITLYTMWSCSMRALSCWTSHAAYPHLIAGLRSGASVK